MPGIEYAKEVRPAAEVVGDGFAKRNGREKEVPAGVKFANSAGGPSADLSGETSVC
jgi:hypothetical protein